MIIECTHRVNGTCEIASSLIDTKVFVDDSQCQQCIKQNEAKTINNVTVSIAVYELSKVDKRQASLLANQYREHLIRREEHEYDYPCISRGSVIGEIDCKCQGNKKVYSCQVHTKCAIRKLAPGKPRLIVDNQIIDEDIKFCNDCEDRKSE